MRLSRNVRISEHQALTSDMLHYTTPGGANRHMESHHAKLSLTPYPPVAKKTPECQEATGSSDHPPSQPPQLEQVLLFPCKAESCEKTQFVTPGGANRHMARKHEDHDPPLTPYPKKAASSHDIVPTAHRDQTQPITQQLTKAKKRPQPPAGLVLYISHQSLEPISFYSLCFLVC